MQNVYIIFVLFKVSILVGFNRCNSHPFSGIRLNWAPLYISTRFRSERCRLRLLFKCDVWIKIFSFLIEARDIYLYFFVTCSSQLGACLLFKKCVWIIFLLGVLVWLVIKKQLLCFLVMFEIVYKSNPYWCFFLAIASFLRYMIAGRMRRAAWSQTEHCASY